MPASPTVPDGPEPGYIASEPTGIATVVIVARLAEVDETSVPAIPIKTGEHNTPLGSLKIPKEPSLKHLWKTVEPPNANDALLQMEKFASRAMVD